MSLDEYYEIIVRLFWTNFQISIDFLELNNFIDHADFQKFCQAILDFQGLWTIFWTWNAS